MRRADLADLIAFGAVSESSTSERHSMMTTALCFTGGDQMRRVMRAGVHIVPDVTPAKSILDPSFRYVPSYATDVRQTFERIRREQETVRRLPADAVVQINPKPATGSAGAGRVA